MVAILGRIKLTEVNAIEQASFCLEQLDCFGKDGIRESYQAVLNDLDTQSKCH